MLRLPAGRDAIQGGGAVEYERHRPERTLLYQLVEEYYPAFMVRWAAEGKELPDYVQREFEDYLKRVFNIDIETCRACGGAVKVIACIQGPAVIDKILTHRQEKVVPGAADLLPQNRAPPAGLFD